jgi:ribosomal protein L19
MNYFNEFLNEEFIENLLEEDEEEFALLKSNNRNLIPGLEQSKSFFFSVGEFLKIMLYYKNSPLIFEGLCLSISHKNFKSINTSVCLRNIILGVGIELIFSFFFSRSFEFQILDYKRRLKNYRRAKIRWFRWRLFRDHIQVLS